MSQAVSSPGRRLLANSASQIGGRLLLSLSRLATAMLIVRWAGAEQFGEYVVVLSFLAVLEWLVDFGQTDIAVRDICQDATRERTILAGLAGLKLALGLLLLPVLPGALYLAGYTAPLVQAAAIGSLGLPLLGGALLLRARFKVQMRMGRDVLAELAGVAVLLPATWLVCVIDAGIQGLMGAYLAGRLVFLLAGLVLLRGEARVRIGPGAGAAARQLLRQALPLGLIGLMVGIYDGLAPVMLAELTDLHQVAQYAGATRYVFPVIIIVQAFNAAFFPLLSHSWPHAPQRLAALQQMALDASVLLAVGMVCGLYAAADALMALLGPGMHDGVEVLRWMCLVVLLRTVSTAMSPLIVISGRLFHATWLTLAKVTLQGVGLIVLAPRFGAMGAVGTCLLIELVLGAMAITVIGQRATQVRLRWSVPLRLLLCGAVAIGASQLLPLSGSLASGVMSGLMFLALGYMSGSISVVRLQRFAQEIRERQVGAAARQELGS